MQSIVLTSILKMLYLTVRKLGFFPLFLIIRLKIPRISLSHRIAWKIVLWMHWNELTAFPILSIYPWHNGGHLAYVTPFIISFSIHLLSITIWFLLIYPVLAKCHVCNRQEDMVSDYVGKGEGLHTRIFSRFPKALKK